MVVSNIVLGTGAIDTIRSAPVDVVCSGSGMNLFAFAGGVWAAKAAGGYRFKRYAGVSGGAIVMTACAAGYEPGPELNNALLALTPVMDLFDPEVLWPWSKREGKSTMLAPRTPWWWPFRSHGVVRGKKLLKVIDGALRAKGVVRFKDLKAPLRIYTTILGPGAAKAMEWGTEETPEALVAPAVLASCRIPGVFQEWTYDNLRHCDGGVWANFPIDCWDSGGVNTLGFYFGHQVAADDDFGMLLSLTNIMMASRMAEDLKDAPAAQVIVLPAGNALDFTIGPEKARALIEGGYEATAQWCKRHPA